MENTKSAIFKQYHSSEKGISNAEAAKRLEFHGTNEIKTKKKKPWWLHFLEEFKDLMVLILIFAAIISAIGDELVDASVILVIVVLNAAIGFFQKFKAEKALEALKKLIAPKARVLRDGEECEIDAKLLVPGDIVILNEGDSITADMKLLEENELKTQEAILTGESVPVEKEPVSEEAAETEEKTSKKKSAQKKEDRSLLFMGTSVAHGTGRAIVIATGMQTRFGEIADLTATTQKDKSPLEKQLHKIGIFVGKITLVISAILFSIGFFLQKKAFIETFLFAASVAVAAVPEGLPATVTIALAIGVQKLARKNAIIKQLSSVETLGSTTVICSDKTGTLTKNEMTVQELFLGEYDLKISGVGYDAIGEIYITGHKEFVAISPKHFFEQFKEAKPEIFKLIKQACLASALCNNARLIKNQQNNWACLGDPTEAALLALTKKTGFDLGALEKEYPRIQELPFSSERKMMSTINKTPEGCIALSKGAPDNLIEHCTHYLDHEGNIKTLDENFKKIILEKNEQMASQALRVLAMAYRELSGHHKKYSHEELEKDLIFIGLAGIIDPPREEVKAAVELTKQAGIKIYIITGDHGLTASAIAQQLGIVSSPQAKIVTGQELQSLSEKKLLEIFKNNPEVIFARVSPEHKLKIVSALKSNNEIVAVTGDGVNDAPALKRSDIGVAMGITGTDVSKEASNMVLADDSFKTIVVAIQEGRTIYENLKKFIFYIFSCNIGEVFTVFAAIMLALPAPLTAILILCVNLGTDLFPALALGVEPHEPKIMEQKPRNPKTHIMTRAYIVRFFLVGIFIGIVVVASFIYTLYQYNWRWGMNLEKDSAAYLKGSTVAFALLVAIQMVNAFNSRSERFSVFKLGLFSNRWLLAAIALSVLILVFAVEVPFIQNLIGTTHLSAQEWLFIALTSLSVLAFEELRKIFIARNIR